MTKKEWIDHFEECSSELLGFTRQGSAICLTEGGGYVVVANNLVSNPGRVVSEQDANRFLTKGDRFLYCAVCCKALGLESEGVRGFYDGHLNLDFCSNRCYDEHNES